MFKKILLITLKLSVTVIALWWVLKDFDTKGLSENLQNLSFCWITFGIIIYGISVFAGAIRWHIILKILNLATPFKNVMQLTLLGLYFNFFFLGDLGGDLAKTLYLGKIHKGKNAKILLSILIDHMCGSLALFVNFLIILKFSWSWFSDTPALSKNIFILTSYISIIISGLMLALAFRIWVFGSVTNDRLMKLVFSVDKLNQLESIRLHLRKNIKKFIMAIGLSFIVLFFYLLTYWSASMAIGNNVSMFQMLSISQVIDVITSLPISISGVGVRETLFSELLKDITNTPLNIALCISVIWFSFKVTWGIIGGLTYVFFNKKN